MNYKKDVRKIVNWLVGLAFQPTLVGGDMPVKVLDDLNVPMEIREANWQDSEGVYSLMNRCCDKAKGSFGELARGLGYTNLVESVSLSYDEGRAKMNVSDKAYVSVSLDQMRKYLGQK